MIVPSLPLKIAPPSPGIRRPSSNSSGRGARVPSYHVSFKGGKPGRAANRKLTTADNG
jgi:hypothetical protein